jgi:ACS family pantothenate transporter-like MFS transporter
MTDLADLARIASLPKTAWRKSDARHEQGWVDQHSSAYLVRIVSLGGAQAVLNQYPGRWHVYLLTILYIIFINLWPSSSVNPFSIWLKSQGLSVSKINIIPTGASAIQLVLTVSLAILSDAIRHRARVMSIATVLGGFSALCLAIWSIPSGLKWTAFFLQRASVPYGPLSMSWANEICGADAEERAIVIGIMNSMGYAFNAWVPLLTFPQVDSPKFRKGFIYSVCAFAAQGAITGAIAYLQKRDAKRKEKEVIGDEEGASTALATTDVLLS